MKLHNIFLLIPFLFAVTCDAKQAVPTPKLAIEFNMAADTAVKWDMGYVHGSPDGFICELVPTGQSVNDWKEIVTNVVDFNQKDPILQNSVQAWEETMAKADSSASFTNTPLEDGSVKAEYKAPNSNEFGIYRFFKGPDGTYRIGYATRTSPDKDARLAIWRKILEEATIGPNPVLKKR